MAFEPIETQEQLESIIAGVRNEYADYDTLKSQVSGMDALRSELETVKAVCDEQAATIKGLETAAQKQKIAEEYGIPSALADRLKGENEEELRSDAANLAPMLKHKKTAPLRDPESIDNDHGGLRKLLSEMNF